MEKKEGKPREGKIDDSEIRLEALGVTVSGRQLQRFLRLATSSLSDELLNISPPSLALTGDTGYRSDECGEEDNGERYREKHR